MKCPNKNLAEWKELEEAVPQLAYIVWDAQNGHPIEKASNGNDSILWANLIARYNGDRKKAIRDKAVIYTTAVRGDIIGGYLAVDANGEPLASALQGVTGRDYGYSTIIRDSIEEILTESSKYESAGKIIQGLKNRIDAIKHYTTKSPAMLDQLQRTLTKLETAEVPGVIVEFIKHVNDTLDDVRKYEGLSIQTITTSQINSVMKDYFGFYLPMLRNVKTILNTTDILSNDPHLRDDISQQVDDLISWVSKSYDFFNNVLKVRVREMIIEHATENYGGEFVDSALRWLDDPKSDISSVSRFAGMSSAVGNPVINIMSSMAKNVMNKTDMNTFNVGIKLVDMLKKAKKEHGDNVMKLFQERDKHGKATGNFTTDLNYGQYEQDLQDEFDRLAKKYNLKKDTYGHYIEPEIENDWHSYHDELNRWYSAHAERIYNDAYFTLRSSMSMMTRSAFDKVQSDINRFRMNHSVNGVLDRYSLREEEIAELDELIITKKKLANIYDEFGDPKTGDDLVIAQEITAFNEAVNKNVGYKVSIDKYNKALDNFKAKHPNDIAAVNKWISRNTREEYTQDFYDLLEQLDNDWKDQNYIDLTNKRREFIKQFRAADTMELNTAVMTPEEMQTLRDLDEEIFLLGQALRRNSIDKGGLNFNDIAEFVESSRYRKDYEKYRRMSQAEYEEWFERSHYDTKDGPRPISAYMIIRPKDSKYIKRTPISLWSDIDPGSAWANPNYNEDGEFIQPKRSLYDNTTEFNKIKGSAKELYNELMKVMVDSNDKVKFLEHTNNRKLPQIRTSDFKKILRSDQTFKAIKYVVDENLLGKVNDQDTDINPSFDQEEKLRPDNSPINVVPTRYMRRLEDPAFITDDVVGSVIAYYGMAENFKNMVENRDGLELMLEALKQSSITGKAGKAPGAMNSYLFARKFIEMNVYGKRKDTLKFRFKKNGDVRDFGKILTKITTATRTTMLSFNAGSIFANFVTFFSNINLVAMMGRYFDAKDTFWADQEVLKHMPGIIANIGNVNHKDKVLQLMQLYQVARANNETFSELNHSPIIRGIIQHFWYNGYSAGDFAVKARVLLSTMRNVRLIKSPTSGDMRFMPEEMYIRAYYPNDKKKGKAEFRKSLVTAYDAYILDPATGNLVVDPRYKKYMQQGIINLIKNKTDDIGSRFDGSLTSTDRSAIHANVWTQMMTLVHNFIIRGITDRFKMRHFAYNTGMEEEGTYRTIGRMVAHLYNDGTILKVKGWAMEWENMSDMEKANVRLVVSDLVKITAISAFIQLILLPMADDSSNGDDWDWFIQCAAYLAVRVEFEFLSMYNPLEFVQLMKNPSAAITMLENGSILWRLLNPLSYLGAKHSPFRKIERGPYEDIPMALRNLIKMTPAKNIIEMKDPKSKRVYVQGQLLF
jgi:hypothetical protein